MLEAKLPFPSLSFALTTLQKLVEHGLEQLPRPVPVGVTQRCPFGRVFHSQVLQLPFAGGQPSGDFPQALGVPQLAEQHRDQLAPTGKASGVTFGLMLTDGGLKLQPRQTSAPLCDNLTPRGSAASAG